ncbi:exodeoxyribonuclease V, gamma subunit [Chlamydia trachomatis]|nr:exodeoxyribonuclease V, gamma subunit [Chlamydia trachomatis]
MNELSHSQATFSNYPEVLLAKLAQDLFSINQTPMTKRWILVPSSDTDHWLRRELVKASSNHIFMGTHIFASFDAFVKYLFTGTRLVDLSTPDHITLPLTIYNLLKESSTLLLRFLILIYKNFLLFSKSFTRFLRSLRPIILTTKIYLHNLKTPILH